MNPLCCIAPESIENRTTRNISSAKNDLVVGPAEEVVGTVAVAGVLYKWVNYGKGWRARWFVPRDGVLSYFKVHGPDKISVGSVWEGCDGVRVIGEESVRRVRRDRHWGEWVGPGGVAAI